MARRTDVGRFTVSGPGVDKGYQTAEVATSAALTFADRSRRVPATFYVRDVGGEVIARAEHDRHGRTHLSTFRVLR